MALVNYPSISSPNYEDAFPPINDHAKKKFPKEISDLKEVWKKCHQFKDENEQEEILYQEGLPYKLYARFLIKWVHSLQHGKS